MNKKLQILIFFLCLCGNLWHAQNKNIALVPYQVDKQYGLSDTLGKVIIKPQFSDIKNFGYYYDKKSKKLADSRFVVKQIGKYFLIDYKNQHIIPPVNKYDSIILDSEDCRIAFVYVKGKKGVFFKNREIVEPIYDKVKKSKNLSFEVVQSNKKAIINSEGTAIFPLNDYKYIGYEGVENGRAKWSAKNMSDKWINTFDMLLEKDSEEDSYVPYGNNDYKFPFEKEIPNLEEKKKTIGKLYKSRSEYSFMKRYSEVGKDGLFTFYDFYLDKELFPLQYEKFDMIGPDHNTILFAAKKGSKYGLLNLDGEIILPEEYDQIRQTKDGVLLKKNDKYGLYIPNTIYKYMEAKYNDPIKKFSSIPVSESWSFAIYKTGDKFIGENGTAYFKQ